MKNYVNTLNSKLYQFICKICKWSGFNTLSIFKNIPYIDNFTGTLPENPDHVWTIIDGEITEIFKRVNNGNVYYIDPNISIAQRRFAQKGNPNRPHVSVSQTDALLVAGDKVILKQGTHTGTFTTPDVTYFYEQGAIHNDVAPFNIVTTGDVIIDGYGVITSSGFTDITIANVTGNVSINVKSMVAPRFFFNKTGGNVYIEAEDSTTGVTNVLLDIEGSDTDYHFKIKNQRN